MSTTPAPTASNVSNGRTKEPAGYTSILMRPPVAAPIACANRTALVCRPGVPSGQSVAIFRCRFPWAIAGAGKARLALPAKAPALVRTSRRLIAAFSDALSSAGAPICASAHDRSREPAAVQVRALGYVAPVDDHSTELLVAPI